MYYKFKKIILLVQPDTISKIYEKLNDNITILYKEINI